MTLLTDAKFKLYIVFVSVLLPCLGLNGSAQTVRDLRSALGSKTESYSSTATLPRVEYAAHSRGNMQLVVGNNGTLGSWDSEIRDPFTNDYVRGCVYPRESNILYLAEAALWVGAVVGPDTLVSSSAADDEYLLEFWPTERWRILTEDQGGFLFQSIDKGSPYYSEDARSEQDLVCEYDDTRTDPNLTGFSMYDDIVHKPLNIRVTQRTMAWAYEYAEDFVLLDYRIENIGDEPLNSVYLGIWVFGGAIHWNDIESEQSGGADDMVGVYHTHPSDLGCSFVDTLNIVYHADVDGYPLAEQWNFEAPLSAVGIKILQAPMDSANYAFNWWLFTGSYLQSRDWGPRRRPTPENPWRDFGDGWFGVPVGDRNKYYIMAQKEFDYDLWFTAIDHSDEGWLPPPEFIPLSGGGPEIADGEVPVHLLSFGPFDVDPGQSLPLTFAFVGGENFHDDQYAFENYWDPYNPSVYLDHLNFEDLATNTRWASWIYDNPGVDTDGDGNFGKSRTCCRDTIQTDTGIVLANCETEWYKGDGIPDFNGASPPPAPEFRVIPKMGGFTVIFNGLKPETTGDQFTGEIDFEGYRVYLGRDNRVSSYSMVASYDLENYNKHVYNHDRRIFEIYDNPFTVEQLQTVYGSLIGDSSFDPVEYTENSPYVHPDFPDSIFYFAQQDFNQSLYGVNTPIIKLYPDQPYPTSLDPALAQPDELTEDGRLKYFEYQFEIENLLPTVPYHVNVTAFDHGAPRSGLGPLESPVTLGSQLAYPLASIEQIEEEDLKVFVYPNPYRADADYEAAGFENRDGILSDDRMRRIHFANLPRVCKIYIYSLDGDLVRELDHNYADGGPEAMHDTWDLITSNTQAAVSGLYYWAVESDQGTQMGKFVIIK